MWSCSSPRKKTPRKNRRPAKQKTPRILPIWGRVLGVLFRCRSIWHKCAACIRRMQYTKGLGLSQQAFCNAKMAFVYTDALLAVPCNPENGTKKRSPRFHTSPVSLASLIARIIVSTSRKSFSSIELSITSMRLLHPLAAPLSG